MATTIVQKVTFKNTRPKALYDLYMDPKKHALISGAPAKISSKPGAKYSVFGGYISGKNLHTVKDKLIVQTWRAQGWDEKDVDSTFIISLEKKGNDVTLQMIHANVPDTAMASIAKGWNDHYWKPWKQHLAGKTITRPKM
ncbi:MAG: SRPBCC domain-containing protein [Ignavibacteriota bacterium]